VLDRAAGTLAALAADARLTTETSPTNTQLMPRATERVIAGLTSTY
jgi:hypothetical protein